MLICFPQFNIQFAFYFRIYTFQNYMYTYTFIHTEKHVLHAHLPRSFLSQQVHFFLLTIHRKLVLSFLLNEEFLTSKFEYLRRLSV